VEVFLALALGVVAFVLGALTGTAARSHVPATIVGALFRPVVLDVARISGILCVPPVRVASILAFDWYFRLYARHRNSHSRRNSDSGATTTLETDDRQIEANRTAPAGSELRYLGVRRTGCHPDAYALCRTSNVRSMSWAGGPPSFLPGEWMP
jgi:hypothetical protein